MEQHAQLLERVKFLVSGVNLIGKSMENYLDHFKKNPSDEDQNDIKIINQILDLANDFSSRIQRFINVSDYNPEGCLNKVKAFIYKA